MKNLWSHIEYQIISFRGPLIDKKYAKGLSTYDKGKLFIYDAILDIIDEYEMYRNRTPKRILHKIMDYIAKKGIKNGNNTITK